MGKKVLAIYYSQSGQLRDIVGNLCLPFEETGYTVERLQIRLQNDYPFPWTSKGFFEVMPDCVLGKTAELAPFTLKETRYDLIILAYQAWFLSPSIPFNSLMHHPEIRAILKHTPVITVTGARNMWVNAFGKVKKLLSETGAHHVGTIAMIDRHLNLVSIFTIFHWMLGGKKDRWLGIFPRPGVSDPDIANAKALGATVVRHMESAQWDGMQAALLAQKGVALKYHLMFMESKAAVMFQLWAKWICSRKKRQVWLVAFKYYLLLALFLFAPIVYVIDRVFFKLFLSKHIKAKKESLLRLN
ncbi:hypothetical protein Q4E93_05305 [Flavitalea sp. BT771]|uniref:hypothetical protein n=1 Tax=Flavitalea sp. BT771 TaxID=3063329 RepID=UPI0026E439C4|nr:hypothetical protein [Flavitalea sp. BT771]MDO6429989.1 hypothetical protein [Flavitalea sp. BT771]MDV6217883.1 hypothetical protein [Flavitalea sp. BT771]